MLQEIVKGFTMPDKKDNTPQAVVRLDDLLKLFDCLIQTDYEIIGPTVSDQAVIYDKITTPDDLPKGVIDQQDSGSYRLVKDDSPALFGYVVGPHSWKKYLYPSTQEIWRAKRTKNGFDIIDNSEPITKRAFIGVRPCELKAIAIYDQIFLEGPYADPMYKRRRENSIIIAVNCTRAGGTCFCVSMKTGPEATSGFDLALTEIIEKDEHYFIIETGSETGVGILSKIPHKEAAENHLKAKGKAIEKAKSQMGRTLNTDGLDELLKRNFDHPNWQKIAGRCLTCGNCTMVCPTCFCTTTVDSTDLTGSLAIRSRQWDSCFTMDFSYIAGGSIRASAMSRYRQWMTHKLANWHDQFGMSGCVGCGRCITWCPAGIDITEEARVFRESEHIDSTSIKARM
jgi:sulfhydrogenase subunit beta (sulfur reductase)